MRLFQGKPTLIPGVLIWVGLVGLLILAHLRFYVYPEDDAYIHFRVAEHFASEGKPYFNLDEPVQATSSPAWLLLLSLILKTGLSSTDLPTAIAVLNALFTAGGSLIFSRILTRIDPKRSDRFIHWLFAMTYIALLIVPSISLMETPFALFIFGIGLDLYLANDERSFLLLGAMLFIRLELAVALVVLLGHSILRKFSIIRTSALASLAILPFLTLNMYYWHTLIPNSITAKQRVYTLAPIDTLDNIAETLSHDFFHFGNLHSPYSINLAYLAGFMIVFTSSIIFLEFVLRLRSVPYRLSLILFSIGGAIALAYVVEHVLVFNWYVPLYSIPVALSLFLVIPNIPIRSIKITLTVVSLPALLSVLLTLTQVIAAMAIDSPPLYPNFANGARVRKYIQIGNQLFKAYPSARLMTSEIGGIGYGFQGYILDGAGLASPAALAYHPMPVPQARSSPYLGAIPVGFVESERPEILVSYDIFIEAFVKSEVSSNYLRIQEPVYLDDDLSRLNYPTVFSSSHMNIYIRADLFETFANLNSILQENRK